MVPTTGQLQALVLSEQTSSSVKFSACTTLLAVHFCMARCFPKSLGSKKLWNPVAVLHTLKTIAAAPTTGQDIQLP